MKDKLNKGQYLEALDRSYSVTEIIEIIEIMLSNHPVFKHKKHKEWRKRALKAQDEISELYHEIGDYIVKHDK